MRGTLREWIFYSTIFAVFFVGIVPLYARADGAAADAMCANAKTECPCAQVKNPKTGKCEQKSIQENPYMCPMYCKDTTNGHKTVGHCIAPGKCHGDLCDGKPCEQSKGDGKPPELPKPPGGGGGGSPPPSGAAPCDPSAAITNAASPCPAKTATSTLGVDLTFQGIGTSSQSDDLNMRDIDSIGTTSEERSTFSDYINKLRGFFDGTGGAIGQYASDNADTTRMLESILNQLGVNPNLGDFQEMTPPPGLSSASKLSDQARDAIEGSFVPQDSATGFMPPPGIYERESFHKRIWDTIKSWLHI